MYSLFRDLAIIILSAKFFGLVARKCKAPQVVGEIIAGLLIGPCVLNLVQISDSISDGAADVLRVAVQHALDGQGCPLHKLRRGHPVRQQCGVPCCGAAGGNIHRRAIL